MEPDKLARLAICGWLSRHTSNHVRPLFYRCRQEQRYHELRYIYDVFVAKCYTECGSLSKFPSKFLCPNHKHIRSNDHGPNLERCHYWESGVCGGKIGQQVIRIRVDAPDVPHERCVRLRRQFVCIHPPKRHLEFANDAEHIRFGSDRAGGV